MEGAPTTDRPEVSVVLPCLDEAETLGRCLQIAATALREHGIHGELIVADNGSTDGSPEIARDHGARVVRVEERGYGAALIAGITAARGRFVVMGDADLSYDFAEIPRLVAELRNGSELVMGCRLPSGGGRIEPGAMPILHRIWGNPMLSWIARWWFGVPVHDVYCGLRAFTRELWDRLDQRATGMEFALEMIVKAALFDARIAEIPIILHPDGRTRHTPHLRTFRDGWRSLRFFLMSSPRWLFLVPGLSLAILGGCGYAIALPELRLGSVQFGAHTLLVASLALLTSHQTLVFGLVARTFATTEGLLPPDPLLNRFFAAVRLESGIAAALASGLCGTTLLLLAVGQWRLADFGPLEYSWTMRLVIPGATLVALGVQTLFASFLVSMIGVRRR